jgi:transcriptional regulator with GAF, ATPase, and Fis domain
VLLPGKSWSSPTGAQLFWREEIEDLSPFMEAELLRVLPEGAIQKVGAQAPRKVDVEVTFLAKGE